MRNYNFRKKAKLKEQKRKEFLWNTGYWPTMPNRGIDEDGNEYFMEGSKDVYKQYLKRKANKCVRKADLESIGSSRGNYKKVFNLPWEWF